MYCLKEELRLQRKREREGEQDAPALPEDRVKDSLSYDQGNHNRWDRGRNDGAHWRSRDHRGRGGRFYGGRRFAPYARDRQRSRESRSPRRRSRSPPRKSSRAFPRGPASKFSRPRSRSPYRKGNRSPQRHSPRSEDIKQLKRHGSESPSKYHGKSGQSSPLQKKPRELLGSHRSQMREASPGRSNDSDSQARSEHASRALVKDPDNEQANEANLDNRNTSRDQEGKIDQAADLAVETNSGNISMKQQRTLSSQGPNESPIDSGSLRSPSPKSHASLDPSSGRKKKRESRPSLNSSISSKGRSTSPKTQGPSKPRSPTSRYQSPRWKQNGRESNRFASKAHDHRRDIVSRRRDFASGPRSGYGRSGPNYDRSYRRHDTDYDYRPRNTFRGRGASSGSHYDRRARHGSYERGMGESQRGTMKSDQSYWRGDRIESPIRERRSGYAYRGVSPQALKSRVEASDKSKSPDRLPTRPYEEDAEAGKPKSPDLHDNPRPSSLERNTSDLGGESSGGEAGLKRGKKRKKEKKSKSKKHKKHKDSKKHKRSKVLKPDTPTSSNDLSDKKSNEKRIEDLRKKALESMGMSSV